MANPVEFIRRLADGRSQRAGNRVVVEDEAGNPVGAGLTNAELRAESVEVGIVSPDEPIINQVAVPSPADRIQLIAVETPLVTGTVFIVAGEDNTDPVLVGGSDVTATADGSGNGIPVYPGQSVVVMIDDLSQLYIHGTADDWIAYSGG